jgi:hypothetical protein
VAFIYARFDVAFILARRAPLQGFARRFQTSHIYSNKKGFTFGNVLHFTLLKQAGSFGLV